MSIMGGAFLQGMGAGIAGVGALGMKYQAELDELALKRDALLERLKMEYGLKEKAATDKAARIDERRKGFMGELGVEETTRPETDAEFRTEVADESGGHTGVDSKKYDSYKRRQQEGGMMARMLAESDNPEQSQKALSEWRTRQLTLDAPNMDSALEGGRRKNAYQGDPEHAIEGNTGINKFTGDMDTTDLGKAMARDEDASARHHGASAAAQSALAKEREKGNAAKSNSPGYKALEAQFTRADGEVNSIERALDRVMKQGENATSKDRIKYEERIARLEADLENAKKKRNDLSMRLDKWTEDTPGAAPKGKPPLKFDNQGRRIGG